MADRYWRGGVWNSTANWSATNNGAGGASIPTSADNVYWHTIPTSQTYIFVGACNCLDMDWTGATNSPILSNTGTPTINLYGNLKLAVGMTFTVTDLTISTQATTTGKTITTNGVDLGVSRLFLLGAGGEYTLQDDLKLGSVLINAGTLITNNKAITAINGFTFNTSATSLILGSSVLSVGGWDGGSSVGGRTFNKGTSSIIVTGATKNFFGGGFVYNNVTLNATTVTMRDNNTFSALTISAGVTLKLTSGNIQTVNSLTCNGTLANPNTIQTTTASSPSTINLPVGRYFIRHTSIKDTIITGPTSITCIGGQNVSGNTGITFVAKFEMGRIKNDGSFNWYSAATGLVTKVSG